jgi:alkylation response protein AidB-like acyl-CoA dehydrogenase
MISSSARAQRTIVEECLKWISQRKAFGKPLASQAVIRSKVAAMIARIESVQSWLENITHQMNNMVRPFPGMSCPCTQHGVVVQGASQATRWPNRPAQDVCDPDGTGHSTGRCPDLRWTWYHSDRHGALH